MQNMPVQLPETFSQNPTGAEVGIWPLAWGWWLVIAVTIIATTLLILWYRSYRHKRQILRQAQKAIKALDAGSSDYYAQYNRILKRAFLGYFPEKSVASLHGKQWQDFIRNNLSEKRQSQLAPLIAQLGADMYQANSKQSATSDTPDLALTLLKATLPPGKRQLLALEGAG